MSEIELHRKLLGDGARNAAFAAALGRLIEPGRSTVVDIGAGTGFLSFIARRLGARHCTLIEYTETLELARQLARANAIDGLTFVQGHSAEIRKPPKADIVVSETLGNYALEENLLENLVDARRFLAPGGALLPSALRQFVAPVIAPRLQREIDIWGEVGFELDLSAARRMSLDNMYVKVVTPADLGGVATARLWDDLDFQPQRTPPPSRRESAVNWTAEMLAGATVHGFALWWEADLVPGIILSTSPFAPPTHWEQIYLPLPSPVVAGPAQAIELSLMSDTRREVGVRLTWRTRVMQGARVMTEHAQDTLRGRL